MSASVEQRIVQALISAKEPLCKHDFIREFGVNINTVERALAKLRRKGTDLRVAEWRRTRVTGPYCPYFVAADGKPDAIYPLLCSMYDRDIAKAPVTDPLNLFILQAMGVNRKAA